MLVYHYLPEKQMSFLFVLMLAVSTRCIPGRVAICLTSTGGGVTAIGAIVLEDGVTSTGEDEVLQGKYCVAGEVLCSWGREA